MEADMRAKPGKIRKYPSPNLGFGAPHRRKARPPAPAHKAHGTNQVRFLRHATRLTRVPPKTSSANPSFSFSVDRDSIHRRAKRVVPVWTSCANGTLHAVGRHASADGNRGHPLVRIFAAIVRITGTQQTAPTQIGARPILRPARAANRSAAGSSGNRLNLKEHPSDASRKGIQSALGAVFPSRHRNAAHTTRLVTIHVGKSALKDMS
jgi:hypothetical protein